jgi:release factor glutamine methyltransferase
VTANAVLDLCTGSGAVAIALKHERPELEVWAADISAEALATAKANAARLLPPQCPSPIQFRQGDLYEALRPDTRAPHSPFPIPHSPYNIITANAPYIPSGEIKNLPPEIQNEPLLALDGGPDGLGLIKKIISGAPDFLAPGGRLLLEADGRQMRRIAELLAERGFGGIQMYRDLSGQERVIGGTWAEADR